MEIKNAVVIGGGTMGSGIAQVFGMNDIPVTIVETSRELADQALSTIEKNLDRMVEKQKLDREQKIEAMESIQTRLDMEEAVSDASLVVEAVPENFEIKEKVLEKADEAAHDDTILASNTSSLSITRLAATTTRPEQFIGMHFFNPVPIMKLIEIVRGYETSDEVFESVQKVARLLDKTPIEVQDSPGFVSNRILMPMINEAIFTVHEGVASPEDVDSVMKLGMNHPMGPLQLADFIGLDVCLDIMNVLYDGFKDPKYRPCPLLVKMVDAGKLGRKSGEGFYSYD